MVGLFPAVVEGKGGLYCAVSRAGVHWSRPLRILQSEVVDGTRTRDHPVDQARPSPLISSAWQHSAALRSRSPWPSPFPPFSPLPCSYSLSSPPLRSAPLPASSHPCRIPCPDPCISLLSHAPRTSPYSSGVSSSLSPCTPYHSNLVSPAPHPNSSLQNTGFDASLAQLTLQHQVLLHLSSTPSCQTVPLPSFCEYTAPWSISPQRALNRTSIVRAHKPVLRLAEVCPRLRSLHLSHPFPPPSPPPSPPPPPLPVGAMTGTCDYTMDHGDCKAGYKGSIAEEDEVCLPSATLFLPPSLYSCICLFYSSCPPPSLCLSSAICLTPSLLPPPLSSICLPSSSLFPCTSSSSLLHLPLAQPNCPSHPTNLSPIAI